MHPRLLTTPYFTLYTYGLILACAYLSALWWMQRRARREGLDRERVTGLGLWVIVGAILGAKLLMILREIPEYAHNLSGLFSMGTLQAGGDFYGGFLGALLAAALFFAKHKDLPRWRTADLCGPAIALGQAIGRIGCFMAGCCYGCATDMPWGVVFRDPDATAIGGTPLMVPLHPVQIYESAACLALFLFLTRLMRRKNFEGQVILAYSMLYALARFVLEYFRGDADRGFVFGGLLSTSQFIAVAVVAASVVVYLFRAKASRA